MPAPSKKAPSADRSADSLSVELGSWFKAHATGRGVLAIPLVLVLLVVAALGKAALS